MSSLIIGTLRMDSCTLADEQVGQALEEHRSQQAAFQDAILKTHSDNHGKLETLLREVAAAVSASEKQKSEIEKGIRSASGEDVAGAQNKRPRPN